MTSRYWVILGLCALGSTARAAEVSGTFSALIDARQRGAARLTNNTTTPLVADTVNDDPLYGLATLQVDKLTTALDESRLVLMGWGRLQAAPKPSASDDPGGLLRAAHDIDKSSADLQLGYLQLRKGELYARVGRQHLLEGVDRMLMIDGIDVGYHTPFGVGASAFFGWVVKREMKDVSGEWAAGGRLSYRLGLNGEVGVSYSQRQNEGEVDFSEVGIDGFYNFSMARVIGLAVVGPVEKALAEARLAVSIPAQKNLMVTVDGLRIRPDMLIPRTSIFSVFAEDNHDEVGGDVQYAPTPFYAVGLEGHFLRSGGGTNRDGTKYDADLGWRGTVRASTYREASHRSQIGIEARRLSEKENGYWRGRVFTTLQVLQALRIAADAYGYLYDEKVNAENKAIVGQLSSIIDINRSFRVAATVSAGSTPFAKQQVEGWLRLGYGYETDLAREYVP
jgi:hypothetical protein